jgi:hypothetical protein
LPEIITFDEALQEASSLKKKHLLLGNGFSIACRSDIFTYGALFDRADFSRLPEEVRNAFDALETRDFEVVMDSLQNAAKLLDLYSTKSEMLSQVFRQNVNDLKDILVSTIANSHPDHPFEISSEEYQSCQYFLSKFNLIYTLNYDLLLYWSLMRDDLELDILCDDGFRTPDEGPKEYVTWDIEKTIGQNIFYLHGALHLFDAGYELKKFTWKNTEVRLIDQIRDALGEGIICR